MDHAERSVIRKRWRLRRIYQMREFRPSFRVDYPEGEFNRLCDRFRSDRAGFCFSPRESSRERGSTEPGHSRASSTCTSTRD